MVAPFCVYMYLWWLEFFVVWSWPGFDWIPPGLGGVVVEMNRVGVEGRLVPHCGKYY